MAARPSIVPALLLTLVWAAALAWIFHGKPGFDLAAVYLAAQLAGAGHLDHIFDRSAEFFNIVDTQIWLDYARAAGLADDGFTPYVYPPLWAKLLAPLAERVSFGSFLALGQFLEAVAIGATVLLAARQWCPRLLRPLPFAGILLAVGLSRPMMNLLVLGQPQAIAVLLILVAIVASQERRPALAGTALAIVAAMKIVPGVLALYWLCTRRGDCALWFAGVGISLALLSIGLAGWPANVAFLESTAEIGRSFVMGYNNQSLPALIGHIGLPRTDLFEWRLFPLAMEVRGALAAAMVVILGVAIGAGRRAQDERTDATAMLTILLAAMLTAPLAWTHYYVFLAVSCIVLLAFGNRLLPLAVLVLTNGVVANMARRVVEEGGASTVLLWPELAAGLLTLGALLVILAGYERKRTVQPVEDGAQFSDQGSFLEPASARDPTAVNPLRTRS